MRLRLDGFEDIEDPTKAERPLKQWDFNFFRNNFSQVSYRTTLEYYEEARNLLDTPCFESDSHREIWAMHCEGMSEREIADHLGIYKKSMIHYIIAKYVPLIKKR